SMLQLGYGYPMWHPDPDRTFQRNTAEGVFPGRRRSYYTQRQLRCLFSIFHSIPDPLNPPIQSDGYLSSMDVDLEKNKLMGKPSGDRGALLSLPHGLEGLYAKNASNWYKYALREGLDLNRHSLYLVTGRMKTNSWGIATFDQVVPERDRVMVIGKSDRLRLSYEPFFNWKKSGGASFTNAGPFPAQDISNQSLFIRGFKISLSEEVWSEVYYSEGRIITNENVIISDFPPKQILVHPLDIINEALLSQIPVARAAITHDNLWIEGCKEMNYDIEQITKAIPDRYLVCYRKDTKTCTLEPRIDNSSLYLRATDI
ncbi:hypothetical protein BDQ17DRAFT_1362996, partial [Cyathus striatus]